MKQLISTIYFLTFILISLHGFAAPLSGVYTIGGASPSYATFSAALSDLNTNGVSGPVIFNVRPGTYHETITVNSITGASATNRITFQSEDGVAGDVIITAESYFSSGSYYNPIFVLNGAQYFTFNNLTITYSTAFYHSGYLYVFLIQSVYGSSNDSINHCILNGFDDNGQTSDNYIIYDQSTNTNLVINGCQFNGGAYAYSAGYSSINGPTITNNTFNGQNYGVLNFYNCDNVLIQGNTIGLNKYNNPSFIAIEIDKGSNINILDNKIMSSYGYGLYFNNPSVGAGLVVSNFLVANNFIEAQYGVKGAGLDNFNFYNNSISTTIRGMNLTSGSGNVLNNNIFYSTGSGKIFDLNSAADFSASDYNDFHSAGTFGTITPTNYANLASWQTGTSFDAHSHSVLPPFVSDTDYHLISCDSLRFGIPLALVPYDIDSNLRSLATTVVGAYECPTAGTVQFTANNTTICAGQSVVFTDQSAGSPSKWTWTFDGGTPGSSPSQNPAVTYNVAGTYNVKLIVTNSSGKDSLTKSGYITVNPQPAAGTVSAVKDTVCAGTVAHLSVSGNSNPVQWQSSTTTSNFATITGATDASYNSVINKPTYFRVYTSSGGCSDTSVAFLVRDEQAPVDTFTNTAVGLQATFSFVGNPQGLSFSWNFGDTTTSTEANPVHTYKKAGNYQVCLTLTSHIGCADSVCHDVEIIATGISTISTNNDFSIYPNPFNNNVTIDSRQMDNQTGRIEVCDMLGRVVLSMSSATLDAPVNVNLSYLTGGLYYLKIETNNTIFFQPIIKQ